LALILAGGRGHGRGVRAARAGRGERGPRGRRTTPATTFRFDFEVLILWLLAGDGQARARRVRGRHRRGGRGHRQAARRADAPHVLQDAHGVGHQHSRRVLRAAPRRRGLLPASGAYAFAFQKWFLWLVRVLVWSAESCWFPGRRITPSSGRLRSLLPRTCTAPSGGSATSTEVHLLE
jgi:hypothetical protein